MDCHFLLQGIFPTQGSNPGLPHCRQTLYRLSHKGSQPSYQEILLVLCSKPVQNLALSPLLHHSKSSHGHFAVLWKDPQPGLSASTLALLPTARKSLLNLQSVQFSSVAQSCPTLCDPMNCSTPGLPVHHQLLESTKFTSTESVTPFNHLFLCRLLLLPHSIFPSIRIFPNESVLGIRWLKYWSFSFSFSPF